MIKVLRELILDFDPEYQQELRENIIIAGCGSRIQGLAGVIEQELTSLGKIKIRLVEDPIYAGAVGGLKLAQDMPLEEWNRM
jgi:rod shape-determining protein MreB